MAGRRSARRAAATAGEAASRADALVAELRSLADERMRLGYARYGIVAERAFGMSMDVIKRIGRREGRDHALALALWETGWYEARMLAAFVAEPADVTPDQMDRWCRDFDNWAVCDTVCFHLFDRCPHALAAVRRWARRTGEFERRAAFALLASVALHDRTVSDAKLLALLPLAERAATDGRNFVKKAVSWALRAIGGRGAARHAAVCELAERLAASDHRAARWVGKDTLEDLRRPLVLARLVR